MVGHGEDKEEYNAGKCDLLEGHKRRTHILEVCMTLPEGAQMTCVVPYVDQTVGDNGGVHQLHTKPQGRHKATNEDTQQGSDTSFGEADQSNARAERDAIVVWQTASGPVSSGEDEEWRKKAGKPS